MKRVLCFCIAIVIGFAATDANAQRTGGQKPGMRADAKATDSKPTPVALKDGAAKLAPENSKVDFIGTHVGDEPKPRLGGFEKFSGTLTATDDGSSIKSITMEFETDSLWTEIGDSLTSHLKNEDFLDVKKYPTAKFVSTSVKAGEKEGSLNVVGDFTLMDKTNEITIPVMMKKSDDGVLVKGDFMLDRVSFGMSKMADRVSKEVSITLSIGEKTTGGGKAAAGNAGGRGQGGRRNRDPAAMFKNQDANSDGKLTGDEIPQFLQDRMDAIDTDSDEAITLKELEAMMKNRGGGRGQGRDR